MNPLKPSDPRDQNLIEAARRQLEALRASPAAQAARQRLDPLHAGTSLDAASESGDADGLKTDNLAGYEITGERFRGGQGVVYEAIQTATKRRVAIKVLYEGPLSNQRSRQRFRREIEILGQIRHPHVVTIHDSGITSGRLYYVMDFIDGRPLDQWLPGSGTADAAARSGVADQGSSAAGQRSESALESVERTTGARPVVPGDERGRSRDASHGATTLIQTFADERQRIRAIVMLFSKVCDAVNAAHLRGVIHRDLKPGNILIDETGEPRVLDFGLAKFTTEPLTTDGAPQVMTLTGQFVGSLPWSSPEQAAGRSDQIDTRTDVYALGVLLYQLLTNRFPYRVVGAVPDVLRNIRESEPRRPRELKRGLDDEIETIVLKCLQKDPQRRYQTAGELGRDLQHYLNGEPIDAKRDSFAYVLNKQLHRYRGVVGVAGLFALLIVAGLIVSFTLWQNAEVARKFAESETARAKTAEAAAQLAKRAAEAEAARALTAEQEADRKRRESEQVTKLLAEMFGGEDPADVRRGDTTVRELLDHYAAHVVNELEDQPEVAARIRSIIGMAYQNFGEYAKSAPHHEAVLEWTRSHFGNNHPHVSDAMANLALLRGREGDYDKSLELARESLAIAEAIPDNELQAAKSRLMLAGTLQLRGELAQAEPLYRANLEVLSKDDPDSRLQLVGSLTGLANILKARGDREEARRFFGEALEIKRADANPDDPHLAFVENDYALLLSDEGRHAEALPFFQNSLNVFARVYGPDNPRVATCMSNLGLTMQSLGDLEGAEKPLRDSLEIRRRVLPPDHPDVAAGMNNLGWLLENKRDYPAAEELYRQCLSILKSRFSNSHPNVIACTLNLARTMQSRGDAAGAVPLFEEVLTTRRSVLPEQHPDIAKSLVQLGSALVDAGRAADAVPLLRECLEVRRAKLPPGDWAIFNTMSVLGGALAAQQEYAEAEPLLLEGYAGLKGATGYPPIRLREAAVRLVKLYEGWGKAEEAEKWRGELE